MIDWNTIPAFMLDVTWKSFFKNSANVHVAMDTRVGYDGHVYWACWGTSCVNQHIIKSAMRNKKWIFNFVEIFILGIVEFKKYIYSEDGAPWTLMTMMGHHGHDHGAPGYVHGTSSMVPQHDDWYKCRFNQLQVESSIIAYGPWKNTIFTSYYVILILT